MVGLDNFAGIAVKKVVGLEVHGVTDEHTFIGMSKDFGVVPVLDEYKGTTANFTKVREIRLYSKPGLVQGLAQGTGWHSDGQITGS